MLTLCLPPASGAPPASRSEAHTSELQSHRDLHLSLHDALPIWPGGARVRGRPGSRSCSPRRCSRCVSRPPPGPRPPPDRKRTRLNSSPTEIYTFPYTTLSRSGLAEPGFADDPVADLVHRVDAHAVSPARLRGPARLPLPPSLRRLSSSLLPRSSVPGG